MHLVSISKVYNLHGPDLPFLEGKKAMTFEKHCRDSNVSE